MISWPTLLLFVDLANWTQQAYKQMFHELWWLISNSISSIQFYLYGTESTIASVFFSTKNEAAVKVEFSIITLNLIWFCCPWCNLDHEHHSLFCTIQKQQLKQPFPKSGVLLLKTQDRSGLRQKSVAAHHDGSVCLKNLDPPWLTTEITWSTLWKSAKRCERSIQQRAKPAH